MFRFLLKSKIPMFIFDKSQITKTGSSIPTVQHISEASLDHYTTTYLQAMVNMKRVVRKKKHPCVIFLQL